MRRAAHCARGVPSLKHHSGPNGPSKFGLPDVARLRHDAGLATVLGQSWVGLGRSDGGLGHLWALFDGLGAVWGGLERSWGENDCFSSHLG